MSSITIRNLDPAIRERLRVQAAEHGNSIEAEATRVLHAALTPVKSIHPNLYERIHARFAPLGGVSLDVPPREESRAPTRNE